MRRLLPIAVVLSLLLPRCTNSTTPPEAAPAPAAASGATATATVPAASASSRSALDARIPLDPDVRHGVLPNGLTYYIRANHKPEKRAELRLAVNAGSVLETDEQRGLAHFVEHMAFNGTKKFPKQAIVDYLERTGMRFGPDVNAFTSFDQTVYELQLPTDDAKIVDTGFDILHEWAGSVTFDDDRIQKERGVITEEWRLGRGAGARIRDKQFPVLFHGSRYAERLPIGQKEIIQNAPPELIRKFYREWYRPDLMAVIAVGDFDPAAIEQLVRERFSDLKNPKHELQRKQFPIPDHKETLTSVVKDPEATSIEVEVDFKRPPVERGTVADLRRNAIDSIYHLMMNQRLGELSREADPPFIGAFAGSGPLGRTKSVYRLFARVRDGGVERAVAALLTEAKRVDKYGFAETELARAKTLILRSVDRSYEERDKEESGRFISQYLSNFLDQNPAPGIAYTRDRYHELLPGITLAEVNARANQWITDIDRVILVSGPEKKEAAIPDEQKILAVFDATEKLGVTPWVDRVRQEPLVAHEPAAGKVIEETQFSDVGVTRWKLSNGAVVLLKPTDFKNDEVLIRAWHPGGLSIAPDATHVTTELASGIIGRSGIGAFDVTELSKALTGKVAGVGPYISELGEGLQGSASPRDLDTEFQLIYLYFTAPRKDEKAFASFVTNMRANLEHQEAAPGYWFARRMNEVLTRDNPRRRLMTLEDLKTVDLDQALSFYRDRFSDASGFIFTIVGNFEPAKIRPQVEKWIGGLPSTGRNETWVNRRVDPPPGIEKVTVEKGVEPRSTVRFVFHGDAHWSLDEAHQMSSLAELLRMLLRQDLREDRGGVYGVGVNGSVSRFPIERYTFNISFSADPKRVDELIAATLDDIRKLKSEGPSEDFVNRVREQQKRARETQLKENRFWASELQELYWYGLPFSEIAATEQRINAVTRESLRDTARKYLSDSQYVLGVLNPEKTAAAAAPAKSEAH